MKHQIKVNKIWFFLSFVILLTSAYCQTSNSIPKILAEKLNEASEAYPGEEVYIQTSKGIYETGEDLWFKGYVLLSQYLVPSAISKTMYVELLKMPSKKPVWEEKYTIRNGFVDGHLYIPDSLSPGHYILVAQTPNSINNDQEIIKSVRKVKIIQNISSLQKEITPDPPQLKQKELDLSLMPEGGHLLSGLKNKLAFKAVDKYGNPQEVSGTLFENDKTLIEFKSLHAGMGNFYFIPDSKKAYHIELEGSSKKYILPEIRPKGQILQLLSNSSDTLVLKAMQSLYLPRQNMYLRIQIRGVVYAMAAISLNHEKLIKIPVKNFPRGIAEITLFNHELVPVTERLLFVNHDQKLYIKAIADKEIYFTKEKVKIKIKVTDDKGNPVVAHLGASVYDKIYDASDDSKTIESHFLLSTALKGRIYNPEYYFNPERANRTEALDLLMLTQGWRKYEWQETHLKEKTVEKQPYITDTLIGRIYSKRRKVQVNLEEQYVMSFADNSESGKMLVEVDSLGQFVILPQYLQQEKRGYMYFKLLNDNEELGIGIVDPSFERLNKLITDQNISYPLPGPKEKTAISPERLYVVADNVNLLEEVVLKNDRKQLFRDKYMGSLDSLAKLNINNDYVCESGFLNCEVHEFSDKNTKPVEGETYGQYIGFQWNSDRTAYTIQGRQYITYHYPEFTQQELLEKFNLARTKNYYPKKEFYSPVYDKKDLQDDFPDYRNTLYWKPDVVTDKNGEAEIEFYCSSIHSHFLGIIEGVDGTGLLGRDEFKFYVRK